MRITATGIALETGDVPDGRIVDDPSSPFAMVFIDNRSGTAHLTTDDPDALRQLARTLEDTAVRLSAALDACAAVAVNAKARVA